MADIVKELRDMHALAANSCDPQFNRAILKAIAEIGRLRAALRPFAEYPWDVEGVPDDAPLLPVNPQLKVGHVSDARVALYIEQKGSQG